MKRDQKTPPFPEGPRKAAWRILQAWDSGADALEALRDSVFRSSSFDQRDKALITELTQGTLRHLLFLDHTIFKYLDRPDCSLPVPVLAAMRLGTYQLLFLSRIPAHAAVKESVQIIKDSRYRRFSSLVNAVLRKIAGSGAAPVPDISQNPEKHIEVTTSTPRWLVDRLLSEFDASETLALLRSLNVTPPQTLRVNTAVTTTESLIRKLHRLGIRASAGKVSAHAVILEDRVPLTELAPFNEGYCTVQDEGAQLIAPLLEAQTGSMVLDACSAPGGKAVHLAALLDGRAFIVAADISLRRLKMMVDNIRRLNAEGIRLVTADLNVPPVVDNSFDRILLDVPCSGTGVLRRHPEGKWKKDPATISALSKTQGEFLLSASRALKPGGRLLYTTCSILREENEDVVDCFLDQTPGFKRLDLGKRHKYLSQDMITERGELRLWPHIHDCDGFYACLMEKKKV